MRPLETYLQDKVRAITNLRNQGTGMSDGDLFTASQLRRGADLEILSGSNLGTRCNRGQKPQGEG
jgi:hypothetical protein